MAEGSHQSDTPVYHIEPMPSLTLEQGQRVIKWMQRATSYAGFVPPGLHPTHRRRLMMLLRGSIDTLAESAKPAPLPLAMWDLWKHPLRAASLALVAHGIKDGLRQHPPTTPLPTVYRELLRLGVRDDTVG